MRLTLSPHPDSAPGPLTGIEVEVSREGAKLELRYRARGRIGDVLLPAPAVPARRDELWKHTCFEVFLAGGEGGYMEFNFSPSTEWAAYRFAGYRDGAHSPAVAAPAIEARTIGDVFKLSASIDLDDALTFHARLGLSAVIEDIHGDKTYWALAHAPGKPDFHHIDAFASELP